jgi:hypothetical protein
VLDFEAIFAQIFDVYGVITLGLIGYIFLDKKIFGNCIFLLMITMIYNVILKNIFKMPLPETCPTTGYGFPSGHMHFASIFYIWLIFHFRNIFVRILCIINMVYSGYILVKKGYHYPFDVAVTPVFALVSVFLYSKLVKFADSTKSISVYSIVIAFILVLILGIYIGKIQTSTYIAFYFLLGFSVSWNTFLKDYNKKVTIINGIIIITATLIFYNIMKYIFKEIEIEIEIVEEMKWFFISGSVPMLVRFSQNMITQREI